MAAHISGKDLSRRFYEESVRPALNAAFPDLPHSAALLGRGSEVLGYDDAMSADHNCEARVVLFVGEEDHAAHGAAIEDVLRRELPERFAGRATDHEVCTLRGYVEKNLGFDLDRPTRVEDWLSLPEQRLIMLTAGAVHHDGVGLGAVRERFAYYPRDVWLYLLAAGWWRIHPEANLVGRAGFVGDELGSAVIGARLVDDLMRLCFLMERQYAPYSKWLGTAFSRLACGPELTPVLRSVLRAETWQERERALLAAYGIVAAMHQALGITDPVPTTTHRLWDRPFEVVWGDFPAALRARIEDPAVRRIADAWPAGGVDRFRDVLMRPQARERLARMIE